MILVKGGVGTSDVEDEDAAASTAAVSGTRMMRVGIKTGSHSDTLWGAADTGTLLLLDAVIISYGPNESSSMIMTMTMRC